MKLKNLPGGSLWKAVHRCIPPALSDSLYRLLGRSVRWDGSYPTWEAARLRCTGYETDDILTKVIEATRKVEAGEFACERDSVLFDHAEYSWPLLASLLYIRARTGTLRVTDFGGALGSTWRQNANFLHPLENVEWRVVEQPAFVAAGRAEFERNGLTFFSTLAEATQSGTDVCLFSSSLCYVAEPWSVVAAADATNARFLLFDLTPFHGDLENRICIQTVPSSIYSATYPCWIFSRRAFHAQLGSRFRLIESWVHSHPVARGVTHEGRLWERI